MKKQVIFIGGVSGCGKTFITESLNRQYGYIIGKQKRALIEAGKQRGVPWEKVPDHYDELIGEAVDELVRVFNQADTQVMLIDCHYAFKMKKALAMNLEKKIVDYDEPFIQAIDDRLISRFGKDFRVRFVFLKVDPAISFLRVKDRLKNIGDDAATTEGIIGYQNAELKFFHEIVKKFGIPSSDSMIIDGGEPEDRVVYGINKFVSSY